MPRQGREAFPEQAVFELEREDESLCRQEGNIFAEKEGGLAGRGRPRSLKRWQEELETAYNPVTSEKEMLDYEICKCRDKRLNIQKVIAFFV